MKEGTFGKSIKILGSKIVSAKGLMQPEDGISRETPPAEPFWGGESDMA